MLLLFGQAVSPEAFEVASALKALMISFQTLVSKNFDNTPEYVSPLLVLIVSIGLTRFSTRLDLDAVRLHASLNLLLDKPKMATKSKHWLYYHELLGIKAHLDSLRFLKLPSPNVVNMQGPEAFNSVLGRFYKDYTRGLSYLGTPNGKLSKVCSIYISDCSNRVV